MAFVLDINDCGLSLWEQDELRLVSPGYALLDGKNYRFGSDACAQARLHPRTINHRFWWQLSTDPLQPNFGPGRHSADLVHGHLQNIHHLAQAPDQLILAVPGSLQSEQLSLLLGVVEQCEFDVVGLVDRAVTASASRPLQRHCNHLELQLHQALLTHIETTGGHAQRQQVIPIPGAGWLAVQDAVANAIAEAFIKQTRFDPRRKADSEQSLYNQLPEIVAQLNHSGELNLGLSGHRARLEQAAIIDSCRALTHRILQAVPDVGGQTLLDVQLTLVPGLMQRIPQAEVLAKNSVANVIQSNLEQIHCEPGDIRFITRLPVQEQQSSSLGAAPEQPNPTDSPAATAPTPAPEEQPTSYRIEFSQGRYSVHPGQGRAPRVNGEALTRTRELQVGDRLETDGAPALQLVEKIE